MARKGERFHQIPTLWHIGWGYPCAVMRCRRVKRKDGRWRWAWQRWEHDVLTIATARRWSRLQAQGKAQIRRDVTIEMFVQAGIIRVPVRAMWAAADSRGGVAR